VLLVASPAKDLEVWGLDVLAFEGKELELTSFLVNVYIF
jgi:hypothetical protein